jgi:hypothetical protein
MAVSSFRVVLIVLNSKPDGVYEPLPLMAKLILDRQNGKKRFNPIALMVGGLQLWG